MRTTSVALLLSFVASIAADVEFRIGVISVHGQTNVCAGPFITIENVGDPEAEIVLTDLVIRNQNWESPDTSTNIKTIMLDDMFDNKKTYCRGATGSANFIDVNAGDVLQLRSTATGNVLDTVTVPDGMAFNYGYVQEGPDLTGNWNIRNLPTNTIENPPTNQPTVSPSASPTKNPTTSPSASPTTNPTTSPSVSPTKEPSVSPTKNPTSSPSVSPTKNPTTSPSASPTKHPTEFAPPDLRIKTIAPRGSYLACNGENNNGYVILENFGSDPINVQNYILHRENYNPNDINSNFHVIGSITIDAQASQTFCRYGSDGLQFSLNDADTVVTLKHSNGVQIDVVDISNNMPFVFNKVFTRQGTNRDGAFTAEEFTSPPTESPTENPTMSPSASPTISPAEISEVLKLYMVADKGSTDRCEGEDWITLRNTGASTIELMDYILHDSNGEDHTDAFTFPFGISIAGDADLTLCKGAVDSFNFGIGSTDTITLLNAEGTQIDTSGLLDGEGALNKVWTQTNGVWAYSLVGTLEPTMMPTAAPTSTTTIKGQIDAKKINLAVYSNDYTAANTYIGNVTSIQNMYYFKTFLLEVMCGGETSGFCAKESDEYIYASNNDFVVELKNIDTGAVYNDLTLTAENSLASDVEASADGAFPIEIVLTLTTASDAEETQFEEGITALNTDLQENAVTIEGEELAEVVAEAPPASEEDDDEDTATQTALIAVGATVGGLSVIGLAYYWSTVIRLRGRFNTPTMNALFSEKLF